METPPQYHLVRAGGFAATVRHPLHVFESGGLPSCGGDPDSGEGAVVQAEADQTPTNATEALPEVGQRDGD